MDPPDQEFYRTFLLMRKPDVLLNFKNGLPEQNETNYYQLNQKAFNDLLNGDEIQFNGTLESLRNPFFPHKVNGQSLK